MKYLFFRDLEHDGNLKDGKTHHSAGLIYGKHFDIEPNFSGKDYAMTYFDPFEGELVNIWRSAKEIEVFEVDRWEWERLDKIHKLIQKYKIMKYLITYLTKIICSALVICTTGWLTIILSLIFWNDNYLDYIENILVDIWDEE